MKKIPYADMPGFTPASPTKAPREIAVNEALNLLLHHRYQAPQDALITLEVNHVYLGSGGFILTAFRPDGSVSVDQFHEFLNNLELLVRKKYEDCGLYFVAQMDAQIVVINAFPRLTAAQCRENEIYDLTERYAHMVVADCKQYWGVKLYAAVGPLFYSVDDISEAFFFVTETLEYKAFTHNDQQILYKPETIQSSQLFRNSGRLQHTAICFANDIYAKSVSSVPDRVQELLHHLVTSEASSMRNFHFCLLVFVQTFSDELLRLGVLDNAALSSLNILGTVYQASDIMDLKARLISLLTQIQTVYTDRAASRNALLIDKARDYIDGNFQNQALSVGQIADMLEMNQSSLSSMFRLYTGTTLVAYIRTCRVAHAKTLLADRRLTLREIAEQSGFGSVNTMYRSFKAQEGISPGKLRQT